MLGLLGGVAVLAFFAAVMEAMDRVGSNRLGGRRDVPQGGRRRRRTMTAVGAPRMLTATTMADDDSQLGLF